jgi:hypothetical protein
MKEEKRETGKMLRELEAAGGEPTLTDLAGNEHDWKNDPAFTALPKEHLQ